MVVDINVLTLVTARFRQLCVITKYPSRQVSLRKNAHQSTYAECIVKCLFLIGIKLFYFNTFTEFVRSSYPASTGTGKLEISMLILYFSSTNLGLGPFSFLFRSRTLLIILVIFRTETIRVFCGK